MTKKHRKHIEVDPAHVKSEIVDEFSFTLMSRDFDENHKSAISAAPEPVPKTALPSPRITMHIENWYTETTALRTCRGLAENGMLIQPLDQLNELKNVCANIEKVIKFFEGFDWICEASVFAGSNGVLNHPLDQLNALKNTCADIEEAILFFESVDWPCE